MLAEINLPNPWMLAEINLPNPWMLAEINLPNSWMLADINLPNPQMLAEINLPNPWMYAEINLPNPWMLAEINIPNPWMLAEINLPNHILILTMTPKIFLFVRPGIEPGTSGTGCQHVDHCATMAVLEPSFKFRCICRWNWAKVARDSRDCYNFKPTLFTVRCLEQIGIKSKSRLTTASKLLTSWSHSNGCL